MGEDSVDVWERLRTWLDGTPKVPLQPKDVGQDYVLSLEGLEFPFTPVSQAEAWSALKEAQQRASVTSPILMPLQIQRAQCPALRAPTRVRRAQKLISEPGALADGQRVLARAFEQWRVHQPDAFTTLAEPTAFPESSPDAPPAFLRSASFANAAIVDVPSPHAWAVPVFLGWGGFGARLDDAEAASVMRYWEHRFGATLMAVSGRELGFSVSRPPTSHDDARDVLAEHLAICADSTIVFDEYVASLRTAHSWHLTLAA
ncbi:MAG: DUF4253 domain-containing protein [Myxococcota bacterium]